MFRDIGRLLPGIGQGDGRLREGEAVNRSRRSLGGGLDAARIGPAPACARGEQHGAE
ncbi:MAG: hypothetical protein ACLR1G_07525 [Alistipes indistinctus]